MANQVSTQDEEWYGGPNMIPKGHVYMMVRKLTSLCRMGEWLWPSKVESGYGVLSSNFSSFINVTYTREQVQQVINMMLKRYQLFQNLKKREGVTWCSSQKRFHASTDIWTSLIEADPRYGWYRHTGEPLIDELGCIFNGPSCCRRNGGHYGIYMELPNIDEEYELIAIVTMNLP